jgi:uncharacterized protein
MAGVASAVLSRACVRAVPTRLALFALALGLAIGCRSPLEEAASPCVLVAAGGPGSVGYTLAEALGELADHSGLGLCVAPTPTDGTAANFEALEQGVADFAIVRADETYTAYVEGTTLHPSPHGRLRGVAILYPSVLHLLVRSDSPARIWTDLQDAQVGLLVRAKDVTPVVTYADLLAAAGDGTPIIERRVRMYASELTEALGSGEIGGAFVLAAYPVTLVSDLARNAGIRLLGIESDTASRIRAEYPFFKPALVPAGTYPGQQEAVATIAVENLLVTREDVDEETVHRMIETLLGELPRLSQRHEAAGQVDPDLAAATPIPLHPGAARYFRERELLR